MAKAPAPTTTRLLTTVNARYYPQEGVADAYCLDGKFPGKRELRAVNSSIDREARGFLVSVFAYPSDSRTRQAAWQDPLRRLSGQIVSDEGDIDTDINDLAETALDVTGGLKLSGETARAAYFAGIILRDGEMAAVTVGEGLAFIYRQDVLYPLTSQSKKIEAVDLYGDAVEGLEDFIAGEAGAIRYSNIAQVEEGDVIILCNGELFDVIGQKEFMRHLAEAEDHMDAAGLLMTAAASQMPGTPIQVTVSKVEAVKTVEQVSKFSLGRFATQAMEPVIAPVKEAPQPEPGLGRTQRYERQDMVDKPQVAPEPGFDSGTAGWSLPPLPVSEATEPFEAVVPRLDPATDDPDYGDYQDPYAPSSQPGWGTAPDQAYAGDEPVSSGQGDLPVFAYSTAAQQRSRGEMSAYDDYGSQDNWDTREELDRARDYDPYGDYDDYDDGYGRKKPSQRSDGKRRLVFYAILLAIIVICIVALIKLLSGDKKKPVETEPSTTAPLIIPPPTEPEITVAPTEETDPEPTDPEGQIHLVVAGDTWWGICMTYYDRASESLCEKLAEYNDMSVTNLFVGNKIAIPPLSELQGE